MAPIAVNGQRQHLPERASTMDRFRALLHRERTGQAAVAADCDATIIELTGQTDVDSLLEREMAVVGAERARAALHEIESALERIDLGEYGSCALCGEPIPHSRLEAIPYTRSCVACPDRG
jgi:RNA polymerase-binding transcription factor DksA